MQSFLDIVRLARLVNNKRGTRGLRETTEEIGNISPSTLSRVENYHTPDMQTFLALCNWLQVQPGNLFITTDQQQLDTVEEIAALLMSDKYLDPKSVHILARIIKAAYNELRTK